MLTLRHIDNLIQKREEHPSRLVPWRGRTLHELAPDGAKVAIVNDRVIAWDQAAWDAIPADGDTVCFVTVPSDPVLVTVGIIAVVAIVFNATVAFPWLFSALDPLLPTSSAGGKQSATYGFDGIDNQSANGSPCPVVYGKHKVGGQILQSWRSAASDGMSQSLHVQIALSEGPIKAIGHRTADADNLTGDDIPLGMRINDMNLREIKDAKVSIRMGASSQAVMPGFEKITCEYSYDFRLSDDTNITANPSTGVPFEHLTKDPVHGLTILVVFPQGLFKLSKTGKTKSKSLVMKCRVYESDGTTPVTGVLTKTFTKAVRGAAVYQEFQITGLNPSTTLNGDPRFIVKAWTASKIFNGSGKKPEMNICNIIAVNEVQHHALTYPLRAMVGVELKATDRISGGAPRINTVVLGRTMDVWNGSAYETRWSADPAWITRDFAVDPRYGLGNKIAEAAIDDASFDDASDWHSEFIPKYPGADQTIVPLTGTATAAAFSGGLQVITGTGTTFKKDLKDGDAIALSGATSTYAQVVSVISDTVIWVDAALSTTPGQTVRLNPGIERRHRYDGVLDSPRAGWEMLGQIGATCRQVIFKIGQRVKLKLLRQSIPLQNFRDTGADDELPLFGSGSIKRGSFTINYVNPEERSNVIECQYRNREKDYEQDFEIADTPDLDETADSVRKKSVPLFGVVSPTQVRRIAAFNLRSEQSMNVSGSFETGTEAVHIEPLDVFLADSEVISGVSGRLAGTSGGNVQLDQDYTFTSGVLYTYIEVNSSDEIESFDFVHSGTTDTLTFAPLFAAAGDDPVLGRRFSIGRKFKAARPWMATRLVSTEGGTMRKIECAEYIDNVFGDGAESKPPDINPVTYSTPVAVVIAPPVVETSTVEGVSTLALSWDSTAADAAAAGDGTTVQSFIVYWRTYGADAWEWAGETTADSFTFDSELGLGVSVEICVQTVNADGAYLDIESATDGDDNHIVYVIHREDDTSQLITFPADVTNAALTLDTGNTYNLTWDAVTLDVDGDALTPDGYEVRYGNFSGGVVLHDATSRTLAVELDQIVHAFYIRAYFTADSGRRYYSAGATEVLSTAVAVPGYGTDTAVTISAENDGSGALSNGVWIDWYRGQPDPYAMVQAIPDAKMTYLSAVADCGTSAPTSVSVDVRAAPYWGDELDQLGLFASMNQWGPFGEVNKEYLDWSAWLEYSDSLSGPWPQIDIRDLAGAEITATARYFRIRFEGRYVLPTPVGEDEYEPDLVRCMIERIEAKFHRAP